jgi:N-acetylglucosamine-6-sulfatase
VFVLADDFSWDLVRYMPRVRALQQQGMTFSRYFVVNSLCCPSRAAIMTGAFPHNSGIFSNAGEDGGFLAFRRRGLEQQTFATALADGGYRTALMGKYLNSYRPETQYVPPGWTDWVGSDRVYTGYDYILNHNGRLQYHGARPEDYVTDVLARNGAKFIEDAATEGRPFFLELSTYAPHKPYTPAPRHARSFPNLRAPRGPAFDQPNVNAPRWLQRRPRKAQELQRFDAIFRDRVRSVQAVDELVGRVQETLRAQGLDENTYLVFSSDNGYHLGQHRLMPGKMTAFDHDTRVPLIVAGPDVLNGVVLDRIAQSIDLNPTFASIAGVAPSPLADGRSLVALLRGDPIGAWRRAALIEHRGMDMQADDPDLPPPGSGSTPPTYQAIRTAGALYVEYRDGERELYDLRRDPAQVHNVYDQVRPARRARLRAMLARLRQCRGQSDCWAAGF